MTPSRRTSIFYLVIAAALWSTGGLLIKWVDWNPIAISGMRSGISALIMMGYWRFRFRKNLPQPNRTVLTGAFFYAILVLLFVSANKLTTSANAIFLQFTAPVWILVFGHLVYRDPVIRRDVLTVGAVFFGMALFFVGDFDFGGMLGNFLGVLSGVFMALMILSLNKLRVHHPLEIVIWGNAMMFVMGLPFLGSITLHPQAITGILFLGVFQLGIAYVFYTAGIQQVTPIEGILIPMLEPLLNPVWVFLGTGETPTLWALFGGAIVLVSVVTRNLLYVRSLQRPSGGPPSSPEEAKNP